MRLLSLAIIAVAIGACCAQDLIADEPIPSYLFPAGAQRGTKLQVRVGGLNLHDGSHIELVGHEVTISERLKRTETRWFEGPVLELGDSQRAENYPQDYLVDVDVSAAASPGPRYCRMWTSQGGTPAMRFIVGELPEIVEQEIAGTPLPVEVKLPVTINGRIFPREDIDVWSFTAKAGQAIRISVDAVILGPPSDPRQRQEVNFEPRIELTDAAGQPIAESIGGEDADPALRVVIPADGTYQVRIHDLRFGGLQHYVYRLTLAPATPQAESVFPLGGKRGSKTRFELIGADVPREPFEVQLPSGPGGTFTHQFEIAGQKTNPMAIELDDLDEVLEVEPNSEDQKQSITAPAVVNGRIGSPGDADYFSFSVKKGEVWQCDLLANRVGSPLDSLLTASDDSGKDVIRADDISREQTDSQLQFTAKQDGVWTIKVEDRVVSRGGPALAYRLRITRGVSDFKLVLPSDVVTVLRGAKTKIRVNVDSVAPLDKPIKLIVEGLPEGITVEPAEIKARVKQLDLTFSATETARISGQRIVIRGTTETADGTIERTASLPMRRGEPAIEEVLLAVGLPTPFKVLGTFQQPSVPRGSVMRRTYTIERNGFSGPITVRLADKQARHLQGVTGPTIVVPADASEFEYPLYLPPWMLLGRTSRTCVMAIGEVVEPDGLRHYVTYSSIHQNDQMIARVSSSLLSVSMEQESLIARANQSAELTVRIARDASLTGPVRLELVVPAHIAGVSSTPVTIPVDQSLGKLPLHFAPTVGPFNMPLVVRATLDQPTGPVVGEAQLELVSER